MSVKREVQGISINKKRCGYVREDDTLGTQKNAIKKVKEQKESLKKVTNPRPKLRKAIWKCWSICGCGKSLEIDAKKIGWCKCFRCGRAFTYDAVRKYNRRDD